MESLSSEVCSNDVLSHTLLSESLLSRGLLPEDVPSVELSCAYLLWEGMYSAFMLSYGSGRGDGDGDR